MKIIVSILIVLIVLLGFFRLCHLYGVNSLPTIVVVLAMLTGLFGWALPRVLERVNARVWIYIGLLALMGLIVPTSSLMVDRRTGLLSSLIWATLFFLPSLALVNSALLLYSAIMGAKSSDRNDKSLVPPLRPGRLPVISLVLSVLLIIKIIHNLYWLTVWDNTYDPIEYIWLIVPIFAVLLSGLTLLVAVPYRTKLAGLLYILLVPAVMIAVSTVAQRVDFRQETIEGAERTVLAIEAFRRTEGYYPQSLQKLTPFYIFSLPKPMIFYGQDWCYQGGRDYYRLGYVDREHWSDPRLIGRIYKVRGEAPDLPRMCEKEIAVIQKRNPGYPYSYWKESE